MRNVLLDFLNRDSRIIYGLYTNATRSKHVSLLANALNVSALLCRDFCIMPPGFHAECDMAAEALHRKASFLSARLIRVPIRESSLDALWEKKEVEYGSHHREYRGLFDSRRRNFLKHYPECLMPKKIRVGDGMSVQWLEGPDTDSIWEDTKR